MTTVSVTNHVHIYCTCSQYNLNIIRLNQITTQTLLNYLKRSKNRSHYFLFLVAASRGISFAFGSHRKKEACEVKITTDLNKCSISKLCDSLKALLDTFGNCQREILTLYTSAAHDSPTQVTKKLWMFFFFNRTRLVHSA